MSGRRIWVVEDNDQNFDLIDYLLAEAGHRVLRLRDGDELRSLLAASPPPPDLVLLDVNLPEGSGLDLVPSLRGLVPGRQLPIVVVTAHAMRGDRERFLAAGCDGYIAKPIDVKSFVREVARHLAGRREAGGEGA